jgi:predicted DNA-binding helix-hairpin-helix protein
MEDYKKLSALSSTSSIEKGEDGHNIRQNGCLDGIILTHATLPNGKQTTLLKSLLTSVCENDCRYCPMRAGRDFRRTTFQPSEFAQLAVNLSQAGLIQGVFLSSGVAGGGVRTQDKLIATVEILRRKMGYRGYIHLKIMPGSEYDQVLASMLLADRVSINLEAPNAARLPALAPRKAFESELMAPIQMMNEIRNTLPPYNAWKGRWPSSCTQFVVGGAGETDRELLSVSETLHHKHNLLRIYYSALTPHAGTPFEHHDPVPRQREQRLYQADYLIRDYGFSESEISYDTDGQLPLEKDPKLIWAEKHLLHQPLEINRASREELLRIPGIGPGGADAVINARRIRTINNLSILSRIGVQTKRARDFVLLDGQRPAQQMPLF